LFCRRMGEPRREEIQPSWEIRSWPAEVVTTDEYGMGPQRATNRKNLTTARFHKTKKLALERGKVIPAQE
jgi:hypothetical protein